MILQIARFQKVIAITRENNQESIEKYLAENTVECAENIQFEYFDLPYYLRFWKKKGRGALLYFYLWQFFVALWVKSKNWSFDISHNLNFHNDWTPSFLWILGKPFVWGPIGHHPAIPIEFLKRFGWKAVLKNRTTWLMKQLFWKLDPFLFMTKRMARFIFTMNSSVSKKLGLDNKKTIHLPSVGSEKILIPSAFNKNKNFTVLSVGRFVPLKGFDVVISSFSSFYNKLSPDDQPFAQLVLVGKGALENKLKALAKKENIEHAVTFISWLERDHLSQIYRKSKVFLFPSHEGAGMVVSEAFSYGLPVLCFDNCGPGEFVDEDCGFKIPYQKYGKVIIDFSECLMRLFYDRILLEDMSQQAQVKHSRVFNWDLKGLIFKETYDKILEGVEGIKTPAENTLAEV
jgi:glycosyltransferase involved in cell wall biosynthesis